MRELTTTVYNSDQHTDENSLAKMRLAMPDMDKSLTYLWGKEQFADKFTFLMMTEGQGNVEEVNDVQYTWDVMGQIRYHVTVKAYSGGASYPCLGHSPVKVRFTDNWGIKDFGLLGPDGTTQVHIKQEPRKLAENDWEYTLELKTADNTDYIDTTLLAAGSVWVLTAPSVPESGSRGNRSNVQGTGKWTNQISFKRYSKIIEGNLANKVVPIEFATEGGGTTNLWINEEMRQFEVFMRTMNNLDLYISKYNRNTNGEIPMKYWENGKPIPESAGVREMIIEVGNYDTYGYNLTLTKLKNTVSQVFWGNTDTGSMEIIIHAGTGFLEDFDTAIKTDGGSNSYYQAIGDKMVSGGAYLQYGNYFTQYRHISGHVLTVKHDVMFDVGPLAELDRRNGNLHPRTGYPMSSHTGIFVDYSSYDGKRNVVLKQQKGQAGIAKVIPGLAPIPTSWGSVPKELAVTDKDESRYEVKYSRGINIKNAKHCFILECSL